MIASAVSETFPEFSVNARTSDAVDDEFPGTLPVDTMPSVEANVKLLSKTSGWIKSLNNRCIIPKLAEAATARLGAGVFSTVSKDFKSLQIPWLALFFLDFFTLPSMYDG